MKKKTLYDLAEELVTESSVPPHLSGFNFLVEAVVIKSENYTIKLTDNYKIIGQKHQYKYRSVARSIAYAISQSERICEFLSIGKNELFNGRVIALLALKLKARCKIA